MKNFNKKISLLLMLTLTSTSIGQFEYPVMADENEAIVSLSELAAPQNAFLYNFDDAGAGYQVIFSDKNSYTGIEGATITYSTYIDNNYVADVSASKKYISAQKVDALNLSSNAYHSFKVRINAVWSDGTTTISPFSEETSFYYKNTTVGYETGLGALYITTSRTSSNMNVNLYTDTSKTKVNAAITVKTPDGNVSVNNFGTINVRGNSTALAAKKPYNIKFDSKQNLFGMGKAKKWSLLANIFDKTLLRNKIGLDFYRDLEEDRNIGQVYTSMCQPVDLYVDGKYLGNYLLTESVETGETRVDIDESYIDENDDATAGTGKPVTINGTTYTVYDSLLELANDVKDIPSRYDDESYYFKTNSYNEYFAINSPERANSSYDYNPNSQNRPQWVKDTAAFVNAFESVLKSSGYDDATKYQLLSQFIDVDSFVDFYITSEYFMTKDINFSSTRFYIKNGKIYGGPLWDLDLSSGNIVDHPGYTDFYAQGYAWFRGLMNNSVFRDAVKQRFTELQPVIKNLYQAGGVVDIEYNNILQSANMNYSVAYNASDYTGWHLTTNYGAYNSTTIHSTYIAYVNEYKTWLENRNNWLRTQWNITDINPEDPTSESPSETPTHSISEYNNSQYNWVNLPYWSVYFGDWANHPTGLYRSGNSYSDFGLYITKEGNGEWSVQLKTQDLPVSANDRYLCRVKITSDTVTDSVIKLKDDITQTSAMHGLSVGENTLELEFDGSPQGYARIYLDLGLAPQMHIEITSFELINLTNPETSVSETTNSSENNVTLSDALRINGYQISDIVGGFRTLYSVEPTIDNKSVTESGLVYALAEYATEGDVTINSASAYVHSFASTPQGIVSDSPVDSSETAISYAMTMTFATGNAVEFNAGMFIRAYAVLSDGSVVYSPVESYSIYNVADYLYKNKMCNRFAAHTYLYENILKVVNPNYTQVDFNWSNTIAKPDFMNE